MVTIWSQPCATRWDRTTFLANTGSWQHYSHIPFVFHIWISNDNVSGILMIIKTHPLTYLHDISPLLLRQIDWPISQTPQCTSPISYNTLFRAERCTFRFWMVYSGMWDRCILGFVGLVYWTSIEISNDIHVKPWDAITSPYLTLTTVNTPHTRYWMSLPIHALISV